MSDNAVFAACTVLALALHIGALIGSILRRSATPGLVVNALAAAAILAYGLVRLPYALRVPWDGQMLALLALEAVVLVAAVATLRGYRVFAWPSWAAFGLHLCASAVAVGFALTFRIDRLM